VGFELFACTYSASSKLMPAALSETVAVTASVVISFLFMLAVLLETVIASVAFQMRGKGQGRRTPSQTGN